MKLEFNILYAIAIGLVPGILIFMGMYKSIVGRENKIKKLEKEALVLHNTILDLEKEVVELKVQIDQKSVVKMQKENKSLAI